MVPLERRTVVWLGEDGCDAETADRLQGAGVDLLVVPRGRLELLRGMPVVRLTPAPQIAGTVPLALALRLEVGAQVDPDLGEAVWRAIEPDVAAAGARELVLDLPELAPGVGELIRKLAAAATLPIVPVLTPAQLAREEGLSAASAVHEVIVPAYGASAPWFRGDDTQRMPLAERLAPLVGHGTRVRPAVSLRPRVLPDLETWPDSIDSLTDRSTAEVRTDSILDRTFFLARDLQWSDRSWSAGARIQAEWMDASRLDTALDEIASLLMPDVSGWDLVPLPPDRPVMGLDRDALIGYLGGDGPAPTPEVQIERTGSSLRVALENPGPFAPAVTNVGTWLEVAVGEGGLVAQDRGGFDGVLLGTRRSGSFSDDVVGPADAVRFTETFLAPGESVRTGRIRLPSSRAEVTVRWRLLLSDGTEVTGSREG